MKNVEVYVNSEAVKSNLNEAGGVVIDKEEQYKEFWTFILPSDPNVSNGVDAKIQLRLLKDTSNTTAEVEFRVRSSIILKINQIVYCIVQF